MTDAVVQIKGQQHSLHMHVHEPLASGTTHARGQQHPIKLYLVVWGWLFVLSTCSYLVDYFGLHGYLRWSLILLFMVLKAGLIAAVFMHMAWERLALAYAMLLSSVLVLVFVAIMVFVSAYTHLRRVAAKKALKHMIAECKSFYLTMGDYDMFAIYEAPDDAVAARFNLQLGMLGNVRTRTLKAFPEAAYRA